MAWENLSDPTGSWSNTGNPGQAATQTFVELEDVVTGLAMGGEAGRFVGRAQQFITTTTTKISLARAQLAYYAPLVGAGTGTVTFSIFTSVNNLPGTRIAQSDAILTSDFQGYTNASDFVDGTIGWSPYFTLSADIVAGNTYFAVIETDNVGAGVQLGLGRGSPTGVAASKPFGSVWIDNSAVSLVMQIGYDAAWTDATSSDTGVADNCSLFIPRVPVADSTGGVDFVAPITSTPEPSWYVSVACPISLATSNEP